MESRKQGRIPNYKQCLNPSLIKMSMPILLRFIPRRRKIIKVGRRKLEHCFLESWFCVPLASDEDMMGVTCNAELLQEMWPGGLSWETQWSGTEVMAKILKLWTDLADTIAAYCIFFNVVQCNRNWLGANCILSALLSVCWVPVTKTKDFGSEELNLEFIY